MTKPEDSRELVRLAKDAFGGVDVIFLNAGIMPDSPLSALKTDEWNSMIGINIKGVLNGIAAVLPTFIAQKSGHIITTSSVAGLKAYPGGAVYGATKWAVRDLMEVLRMESAQEGTNIRTATIYPATINTELLETITDKNTSQGMTALYEQYGITPDRVANLIVSPNFPAVFLSQKKKPGTGIMPVPGLFKKTPNLIKPCFFKILVFFAVIPFRILVELANRLFHFPIVFIYFFYLII